MESTETLYRSHFPNGGIVDLGAYVTDLWTYRFLGKGAASTVTGYFVNEHGHRIGKLFTYSVPAADGSAVPVDFATIAGISKVSNDAWGFIGTVSADLYFDTLHPKHWGKDIDGFITNYARSPYVGAAGKISFGRVS